MIRRDCRGAGESQVMVSVNVCASFGLTVHAALGIPQKPSQKVTKSRYHGIKSAKEADDKIPDRNRKDSPSRKAAESPQVSRTTR